ncbi:MAG: DUF916 domain-containing protein [Chloroflexi bacterium]|nr:DUF916 domain-containing protein [Chloroflexota bacterium]
MRRPLTLSPTRIRRLAPILLGALVLAGTLLAAPGHTAAQAGISFGIQPMPGGPGATGTGGYFTYTLAPGAKATGQAIVTNEGATAVTLRVYAADAITASGGGTGFANGGESPTGAAGWVSVSAGQVTVGPGQQEVVSITVAAPAAATPGDHVAGIVVEAAPRPGAAGNVNTVIVERAGVAVVVRVPGETVEKLALGEFCFNQETGSRYFEISVLNQGTILSKGTGRFRLETEPGQPVFERSVELGSVVPTLDTVIRVHSPQDPPPGRYVARLTLRQSDGVEVERHTQLTIPEEKVNGCAREAAVRGARDEGSDDNFAVQTIQDFSGGASLLILALVAALALMTWALVFVLWRNRRSGRDDARGTPG